MFDVIRQAVAIAIHRGTGSKDKARGQIGTASRYGSYSTALSHELAGGIKDCDGVV